MKETASDTPPSLKRTRRVPTKTIIIAVLVIAVLALAGAPSYYFYNQYQNSQKLLKNPGQVAKDEVAGLIDTVGSLIELPQNETPTVATVSDKTKLQDQSFFARAENGDKVLIYAKAQKAILYRPNLQKIIEVAPVNINNNQPGTIAGESTVRELTLSPSPLPEKTVRVAIYNGTQVTGLTKKAEALLVQELQGVAAVTRGNAAQNYESTVVIDLSGKQKGSAELIAGVIGGKIASFPQGENRPDADILIILGQDYAAKE